MYCTVSDLTSVFTDRLYSPEDHAILEAEYEKNPKPDKTARTEIVNRVALGEKEVQVSSGRIEILGQTELLTYIEPPSSMNAG